MAAPCCDAARVATGVGEVVQLDPGDREPDGDGGEDG
jgi:hypothetical protein